MFLSILDYTKGNTLSDSQTANANTLIPRVNDLLEKFHRDNPKAKPRVITSGFRSMEDHLRIYREINEKRVREGKAPQKVPMGSKHLSAEAVDLSDADGALKAWLRKNVGVLEECGLYQEHPDYTLTWVHLQCSPPGSGNRVFRPW